MFNKRLILISLGVVVAVLPFVGVPFAWKSTILSLCGVGVGLTAYFIGNQNRKFQEIEQIEEDTEDLYDRE